MATLDLILRIVQTAATLAVGIAASFLAYRQYKINHAKLKFDLYEKRLALFTTLRGFMSEVVTGDFNSSLDSHRRVTQLYLDTLEHQFLFDDPAVNAYFEKIIEKARELRTALVRLDDGKSSPGQQALLQETADELSVWFFEQSVEIIQVFQKDLSIRVLK